MGATADCVLIQPDFIEVSFTNGNYGDGLFDGVICLDLEAGMYILNNTRSERFVRAFIFGSPTCYCRQDFQGTNLPKTDTEVEELLASNLWRRSHSASMLRPSELRQPTNGRLYGTYSPPSRVPDHHRSTTDDARNRYYVGRDQYEDYCDGVATRRGTPADDEFGVRPRRPNGMMMVNERHDEQWEREASRLSNLRVPLKYFYRDSVEPNRFVPHYPTDFHSMR